MLVVDRALIGVTSRQRKSMDPGKLAELRTSISARGLFHAPVVKPAKSTDGAAYYILIAGERRLTCIDALAKDGEVFRYNDTDILPGQVPITLLTLDSVREILSAEFEENAAREDLSWQDRVQALADIHAQMVESNPDQTVVATAEALASRGGVEGLTTPGSIRVKLAEANAIAPHLSDPAIAKARNSGEAYKLVLQKQDEAVTAELVKRRRAAHKTAVDPIVLHHGDSHEVMLTLEDGTVDLILADPPYGVGADSAGFRSRTVQHHNYVDNPEVARAAITLLLVEGWRVAKTTANIFCFSDIDHFPFFKEQASTMGWKAFRTPIHWRKSYTEGMAPWGAHGPRRATEWIFFATKGNRGLLAPIMDTLDVKRVHRSERVFGAQKPVDLMRQLIDCATLPGDLVLDPFMGSGATMAAARLIGRRGIGIEMEEATFNTAQAFVFGNDQDLFASEPINSSNVEGIVA